MYSSLFLLLSSFNLFLFWYWKDNIKIVKFVVIVVLFDSALFNWIGLRLLWSIVLSSVELLLLLLLLWINFVFFFFWVSKKTNETIKSIDVLVWIQFIKVKFLQQPLEWQPIKRLVHIGRLRCIHQLNRFRRIPFWCMMECYCSGNHSYMHQYVPSSMILR